VTNVTLFVRPDADGWNPLADNANETYAGGPGVGTWTALPMTRRVLPKNNVFNDPNINFFIEPVHIADHYWAKVTGYTNVLLDYFVQATDSKGNTHKSEIQHVWVDSGAGADTGGGGSTNACNGRVCLDPAPATQGDPVTLHYSPAGGPLAAAAQVSLHLGWNDWNPVISPDAPMTFNAASNRWELTVTVPASATQLDCVFNNGAGTWDNNGGADWHFAVAPSSGGGTNIPPPAFVLDGTAEFTSYRLSTNGPQLYAAVRGSTLYVACQSAANGSANDHFIFVTDQLLGSASAAAPWAKSGLTAISTSKPFLASEGGNNYAGWFNAPAGSGVTKAGSSAGVLEGTLDLVAAFGALPEVVYVAAAAYATADGGSLASIAPSGSGPNLDPAEFLALPLIAFADVNADGLYDRLDPALGFRIESAEPESGGLRFSYACVPGRSYRALYRESLSVPWSVLEGSTQTATGTQTVLSVTNTPATPMRFYRVELLP
jgi:hypothetical protein